ncbi:MAG: HAMP domain-containing sensor histidine kinase [Polyangiales bacterium]
MRLVFRIYLVGVLLAVMVLGSFIVVARALGPTMRPITPQLATEVLASVERIEDLPAEVERLHTAYNLSIVVKDKSGVVLAGGPVVVKSQRMSTQTIKSGPATGATVTVSSPPPPTFTSRLWITFAIVLVLLGFGTAGAARWLGRPLGEIAGAARSFGSGDLSARVHLRRRDELGEVAQAFDEMADRVERLLRAERELLANVSHELRTPLARIRTALDIATEGDPATAQAMLGEIDEDLGELQRLVEDVLTATRLDLESRRSGDAMPPLRPVRIAVPELIEQAVARFHTAHADTVVDIAAPADLPMLEVDAMLIRRVIDNLLENAWRYGPKRGPVEVRAKSDADKIAIEIEDHGIGISPDDLAKVFTPFFRAETSRTRATGGLGLGLTLAKRILDAHGGTIEIESELGSGTTVRIELPSAA